MCVYIYHITMTRFLYYDVTTFTMTSLPTMTPLPLLCK